MHSYSKDQSALGTIAAGLWGKISIHFLMTPQMYHSGRRVLLDL